ncbi:hypothetical protein [Spirosoma arcticum]
MRIQEVLSNEQRIGYKEMGNDTVFSLHWIRIELTDSWQSVLWSWFPELYRSKVPVIDALKSPFTIESRVSIIIGELTAEYGERKSAVIYAAKWRVDAFVNFLTFFTDSIAEIIDRYLGVGVYTIERVKHIYYSNPLK